MYYILRYLTVSDIVASVRGAGYLQSLMGLGLHRGGPFLRRSACSTPTASS